MAGNAGESYSGGISIGFLFDQNNSIFTSIPPGTTVLDFTGNANGGSYSAGVFGGAGNDILTGPTRFLPAMAPSGAMRTTTGYIAGSAPI